MAKDGLNGRDVHPLLRKDRGRQVPDSMKREVLHPRPLAQDFHEVLPPLIW